MNKEEKREEKNVKSNWYWVRSREKMKSLIFLRFSHEYFKTFWPDLKVLYMSFPIYISYDIYKTGSIYILILDYLRKPM